MSKINDIALQLAEAHRILHLADQIALNNAEAKHLHDDAFYVSIGLERQIAAELPSSVEDLTTQMLVFAGNYLDHRPPEEGCEMDTLHRLIVTRMLEGLLKLSGCDASPIAKYYLGQRWFWSDRIALVSAAAALENRCPN